jgi:hypothetical protein
MISKGITRNDLTESLITDDKRVFFTLQRDIIEEQNRQECSFEGKPFISDRGPDPLVYTLTISKKEFDKLLSLEATQSCFKRYRHSLVIILSKLSESKDDGTRLVQSKSEQESFTSTLTQILRENHIPFFYMSETDRELRVKVLENAVIKGILPFNSSCTNYQSLSVSIPMTTLSSSELLQTIKIHSQFIELTFSHFEKTNRIVQRYGSDSFIMVTFDMKVNSKVVRDILNKPVFLNGIQYSFLGCSSSGLKQRKCYMYKGDIAAVEKVLDECGSFKSIKSVSKQLKRISQLFSSGIPTELNVEDDNVSIIPDIETKGGNFTDGCGSISDDFAAKIIDGALIKTDHIPSVFQIRYAGCKGIVCRDPRLSQKTLVIRKSMKKFNSGSKPFKMLWLCDYSKPYSFGHLNKQFILLFSALGIKDEIFLKKQVEYFEKIKKMTTDVNIAIEVLGRKNPGLAVSLVNCPNDISKAKYQKELSFLQSKMIEKIDKLRIIITESRNIFGVCDPLGVLEYGECFVRPIIRGKPHTLSGLVSVSKNPCYLLGDVRVLTAVDDDRTLGLEHLVDCIVFPVRGKQPHSSEIAGSDLDGDMYFVCWDKDLIVPHLEVPYDYPSTEAPDSTVPITQRMKIDYLSGMNKSSQTMGKIDRHFNEWADLKGAGCEECVELGKLFSRSVDASKTGDVVPIPKRLKLSESPLSSVSPPNPQPVWKIMLEKASEMKEKLKISIAEKILCDESFPPFISESFILSLIQDKASSFSEHQLFRLVHRWCFGQDLMSEGQAVEKIVELSKWINFGKLTIDQKVDVIDVGVPRHIVTNSLNKSVILSPEMLHCFSLHTSINQWYFYFHSFSHNFTWQHMLRALSQYDESLIIFRLLDGVTIALHFLARLDVGATSDLKVGSVIAYFFSAHFGYEHRHVLGHNINLHLNDEILQVYRENDKTKTFLWLRNEIEQKDDVSLFNRLSVDLTQFKRDIISSDQHPTVNKQEFLELEIYVKRYTSETNYFDIYVADQPDSLSPEYSIQPRDIEDVPDILQEIEDNMHLGTTNEDVIDLAESGCYRALLEALPQATGDVELQEVLIKLLTSIYVKFGHKPIDKDTEDCLQQILCSIEHVIVIEAEDCLKLLECLCSLNCQQLIEYALPVITGKMQLSNCSNYLKVASSWKYWSRLPYSLAYQVSNQLHILCQSLLDEKNIGFVPSVSLSQLLDVSANYDVNDTQLQRYVSHFAHRTLLHFITDVHLQLNKKDSSNKLSFMKANMNDSQNTKEKCEKINFTRTNDIYHNEFSIGTYVIISPQSDPYMIAVGYIAQITKHPADIVIEVYKPIPNCLSKSAEMHKGHWEIISMGNVTQFKRSMKALDKILNTKAHESSDLVSVLVHPDAFPYTMASSTHNVLHSPLAEPLSINENCDADQFNLTQRQAICSALKQKITLIHGPPGTGKTHVACAIVQCVLLCNPTIKILIAAETNMAVDNMTRRLLIKNIKVVRIGNIHQISPDVQEASLFQQINQLRLENNEEKTGKLFPEQKKAKEILNYAEVVATTCAGAGDPLLASFNFSFVLIDEATLVIEPCCLIPLVMGCQQLVLIGDPQQLHPHIPSTNCNLEEKQLQELSTTLFHRLYGVLPSFFLDEQHRMHPFLAKFCSEQFYDGKLKSSSTLHSRKPVRIDWINPDEPSVFIDVQDPRGGERKIGTSYHNKEECSLIVKVIKSLLDNEVSPLDITVLTPYLGQVKCISDELAGLNAKIGVSTIDRFQGRENEIIIFSTVRCNSQGALGFTDNPYRMNVLLTRAKKCVIGVGSKETLQKGSDLWSKWLAQTHCIDEMLLNIKKKEPPQARPAKKGPTKKEPTNKKEKVEIRTVPRRHTQKQPYAKPNKK